MLGELARAVLVSGQVEDWIRSVGSGGHDGRVLEGAGDHLEAQSLEVGPVPGVGGSQLRVSPRVSRLVLDPGPQRFVVEQAVEQFSAARPLQWFGGGAVENLRQLELSAGRPSLTDRLLVGEGHDIRILHLVRVPSLDGFQRHHAGGRADFPERPRRVERELPALGDRGARLEDDQLLGTTTFRRGRRTVADTPRRKEVRVLVEALVPEHHVLDRLDRPLPTLALGQELRPLQLDVDDAAALVRDEVNRLIPVIANHDVHGDRTAGRCHLAFNRETIVVAGERNGLSARGTR